MSDERTIRVPRPVFAQLRGSLAICCTVFVFAQANLCVADDASGPSTRFHEQVRPILERHCYDCHGYGESEGQVTLDTWANDEAIMDTGLWLRVLKNVQAGIMPPAGENPVPEDDVARLAKWIKEDAFAIDPDDADPGHVTLRRLNRNEYRRTIQDLFAYDYPTDVNFPPDDTGHGFDNIGDVLSTSPLLVEKYVRAASEIVLATVPSATRMIRNQSLPGSTFYDARPGATDVSCDKPGEYSQSLSIEQAGKYFVSVEFVVYGRIIFDLGGKATVRFLCDGEEIHSQTYAWQPKDHSLPTRLRFERDWQPGNKEFTFVVEPFVADEGEKPKPTHLALQVVDVHVQGPSDEATWVTPPEYHRYFPRLEPPQEYSARRDYARKVLRPLVDRAFRRPVDEVTLDRLVSLAEATYTAPDSTFEQGIQQALIAAISSRRFLFRAEHPDPEQADRRYPLLDEFSLASRMSYLLWNSMPDEELMMLAKHGELRANLAAQVQRMLTNPKSSAFVESFAGQWLRTREVESVEVDTRLILARDLGLEAEELAYRNDVMTNFLREREKAEARALKPMNTEVSEPLAEPTSEAKPRQSAPPQLPAVNLDVPLRSAMRAETESCVSYVFKEGRSILEWIDSDYTFLNERLADHYGIDGVKGAEIRKVTLPADSARGGILTHAGILTLTSQSTRTSAVKRGVYVLDGLLGTPAPPAPPNLPSLEEAEQAFDAGKEPTLREVLEMHRRNPVCSSCHSRMDPIGFALENFNALGMWRTEERGQPIDVAGQLATGEPLNGVEDLRKVIVYQRRADYYRCVTEKLMIYALGRGLEHYDTHAVDLIVDRLEREQGNSFALLMGVIESAPFQKCRGTNVAEDSRSASDEPAPNHSR